ncbi:MAG: N-acetyl-gamma-glutamyl-phosphate reductase [Anaerolineae bacterium]|nr:N-acetyl-gamma-glutamyl-phosphate reductase [Anaerolineae bacterium]
MIKVGILGASGYMGGEALRILNEHPEVDVVWATSRSGQPLDYFHRNFYGSGLKLVSPEEITPVDAIFFAIPTGTPMKMAEELLDQGTKLIDLGADFRLKNRTDWERVYKRQHASWSVVEEAIYGIPELHREEIKQARVIANPGCYSSAAILGLAPLIKANLIDTQKIIVDGLSGTTGAGAEVDVTTHHPEIGNNLIPYNVVDHRHTYEMEQELGQISREPVTVHFTSTYVPITRGILAICHCFPTQHLLRSDILDIYKGFYEGEQFVKVFDTPQDPKASWQYRPYPWVAAVSGTNYCHIGLDIDETRNRLVVFSVLDSIGKGGAHAGVQNLNLMFGLDENTGLERLGLHPY